MQKYSISQPAREKLARLKTLGINPTADEIITLHELGTRLLDTAGAQDIDPARRRVMAGVTRLFPFTIGAAEWYSDIGFPLFGDGELSLYALAYALAFAREPEKFSYDYVSAERDIAAFKKTLGCTQAELKTAVSKLLPPDDDDRDDCDSQSYAKVLTFLVLHCGGSSDDWRWNEDRDFCFSVIEQYIFEVQSESGEASASAPLVKATGELHSYFRKIIRSRENG